MSTVNKPAFALIMSLLMPAAAADDFYSTIASESEQLQPKVIQWRRHIHQNPELSNQEFETAALVARELHRLKFDIVETGVAGTGVVGTLVGKKPGPVVALRADMDALPGVEQTGLPFASTKTTMYNGQQVGIMHACGHDAHVAILLGVAELFSRNKEQLPGTVKFIFQPAEEGVNDAESWGAKLMVEEGVLDGPYKPEVIFGLHVVPGPTGSLIYQEKGVLAASDPFTITISGKQTHGATPWLGHDPIAVAGQMITAMQMIPARQLDVTKAPTVISVGSIHAGVKGNIIPEKVVMEGTVRTLDKKIRQQTLAQLKKTVEGVAALSNTSATITFEPGYPITYNDPQLTEQMQSSMARVAGNAGLFVMSPRTGAEDFSFYQQQIPGLYIGLGVNKPNSGSDVIYPNHSPRFDVDENALIKGVQVLSTMAYDYMLHVNNSQVAPEESE